MGTIGALFYLAGQYMGMPFNTFLVGFVRGIAGSITPNDQKADGYIINIHAEPCPTEAPR